MRGAIPPLPLYIFKAWCLAKMHRDYFTFTFSCMFVCHDLSPFYLYVQHRNYLNESYVYMYVEGLLSHKTINFSRIYSVELVITSKFQETTVNGTRSFPT
jgi:hypothetical protein